MDLLSYHLACYFQLRSVSPSSLALFLSLSLSHFLSFLIFRLHLHSIWKFHKRFISSSFHFFSLLFLFLNSSFFIILLSFYYHFNYRHGLEVIRKDQLILPGVFISWVDGLSRGLSLSPSQLPTPIFFSIPLTMDLFDLILPPLSPPPFPFPSSLGESALQKIFGTCFGVVFFIFFLPVCSWVTRYI